ncbi:molybdenum cofactor guanylyltransferase [Microbulbifer aestuariivivens]|uniref:Molybdenum cofactor guanylyltransferase n=1 Tax=Microbulbifer aestuariivivens TaxID=1908308 RepID=A0ABP9WKD1_9GAMM
MAGGRSSRMGRDKSRLPLPGGELFLERAIGLLRALPLAEVFVSGNHADGIPDLIPGRGPLGGLYSVTSVIDTGAVLVIPVDMPLLNAELLTRLLREGESSGCACYFGDFYFPFWLPLSSEVRVFLRAVVEGRGPRSVGALLRHVGARQLPMPACQQVFNNINTPAEYTANYPQVNYPKAN